MKKILIFKIREGSWRDILLSKKEDRADVVKNILRFKTFNKVYTTSDENKNIENNQEENQNRQECNKKWWKNCWVNDLYPLNRTILVG